MSPYKMDDCFPIFLSLLPFSFKVIKVWNCHSVRRRREGGEKKNPIEKGNIVVSVLKEKNIWRAKANVSEEAR